MAEKAIVRYLFNKQEMVWEEETIEAEGKISIVDNGPTADLVKIGGDAKTIYVHRADLIAVIIEKTD